MQRVNNEESRESNVIAQGRLRWSKADPIPKVGFACIGVTDLGRGNRTSCEMCGTRIRYVHGMEHPEWHERPDVGYVCAGHMERPSENVDAAPFVEAAAEREKSLRRLAARAARRRKDLRDDAAKLAETLSRSELQNLMTRAMGRLRNAKDDGAPTDDEATHIDVLTRRIREAEIASRAKKFAEARSYYATWSGWDGDPLVAMAPICSTARDLVRGAEQDGDGALVEYEAFLREVEGAYDDLVARRDAEEKRRRSDRWWSGQRDWYVHGTGRQFKFDHFSHYVRAWTHRRKDGRYTAAFETAGGEAKWAPYRHAKATEAEAAAMIERVVGRRLVADGVILSEDEWGATP